jgi:plastocyanin
MKGVAMAEPQTWTIDIDEGPTGATFNPQNLGEAPAPAVAVGDMIYWRNNTASMHQPAPQGGADDAWVDPIPGKEEGQPAPTSGEISFGAAATVQYRCAYHPDDPNETGTITIT